MKINTAALSERLASRLQPPPPRDYAESMWEAFEHLIEHIYCLTQLGHKQVEMLAMLKEEPAMGSMTVKTFSRYYQRAIKNAATLRRCKATYARLMATGKHGVSPPPIPVAAIQTAVIQTPAPAPEPAVAPMSVVGWHPISAPLPAGKFRPVPIDEVERANPALQLKRPQFDPKNPPAGFWDDDKLFEHPAIPGLLLDRIERRLSRCLSYSKDGFPRIENGRTTYKRKIVGVKG